MGDGCASPWSRRGRQTRGTGSLMSPQTPLPPARFSTADSDPNRSGSRTRTRTRTRTPSSTRRTYLGAVPCWRTRTRPRSGPRDCGFVAGGGRAWRPASSLVARGRTRCRAATPPAAGRPRDVDGADGRRRDRAGDGDAGAGSRARLGAPPGPLRDGRVCALPDPGRRGAGPCCSPSPCGPGESVRRKALRVLQARGQGVRLRPPEGRVPVPARVPAGGVALSPPPPGTDLEALR
ncbi:unnamed protein product [Merluccius merluccius]